MREFLFIRKINRVFISCLLLCAIFLTSCSTPGMGIKSSNGQSVLQSSSSSAGNTSEERDEKSDSSDEKNKSDDQLKDISQEDKKENGKTYKYNASEKMAKSQAIYEQIENAYLMGEPVDGSEMEKLRVPNFYNPDENPWNINKKENEEMWKKWEQPTDPDMKYLQNVMRNELDSYIADPKGYSMAYMDLTTGQTFTINGDLKIRAASAAKLFIGMYISEMVHKGYFNWDEKFQVHFDTDWSGNIGAISVGPDYASYHLDRLMYCMLTQSDNAATSCISRQWVLRSPSHDYEQDLNRRFGFSYDVNHEIQPNRAIIGLKDLYEDKKGIYSRMKREFMPNNVDNNSTILIYRPKTLHKTGFAYGNVNDFGLVYTKYPYAYVFMTTGEIPGIDEVLSYVGLKLYQEHVNRTEGYIPEG